jgi:xylulokinase
MKRYILAHDLGTSGDKATLFSIDDCRLVRSIASCYPTHYFNNNRAEQNCDDWWKAVCESTKAIMEGIDPQEIAVISFSGQMMGCICVDKDGRPLRPALLYCDQRAVKQADRILAGIDAFEFYKITGHRASASYSAAKLMWIQDNEPDIYARTYKMLHAKDYINFRLTGVMASDYSDASGTNLLDLQELQWSEQLIRITGLDAAKLPDLKQSTDIVGELLPAAAAELGLVAGIPVAAGAGDGLCAGVGVGSTEPGLTYNYLGSSSWIATTSTEPIFDDTRMRTFVWAHAVPGLYHPCGTMQTAGSSYAWARKTLASLEHAVAGELGKDVWELMNDRADRSPPGSKGLVFLPYLLGERTPRWNPDAKGAYIGLTLEHSRDDMIRSTLEGISMNLSVILEIFRARIAIPAITVIGGGAKGKTWRRIMADVYEARIDVPNYLEEATSMGAAIIGGVAAGVFKDFSIADRFITMTDSVDPDEKTFACYRNAKILFDECYDALEPLFPRLGSSAIQEEKQ